MWGQSQLAANIELIIAAFLLMVVVTAVISLRLKVPYTVIQVLLGVGATVTLRYLSLQGSSL